MKIWLLSVDWIFFFSQSQRSINLLFFSLLKRSRVKMRLCNNLCDQAMMCKEMKGCQQSAHEKNIPWFILHFLACHWPCTQTDNDVSRQRSWVDFLFGFPFYSPNPAASFSSTSSSSASPKKKCILSSKGTQKKSNGIWNLLSSEKKFNSIERRTTVSQSNSILLKWRLIPKRNGMICSRDVQKKSIKKKRLIKQHQHHQKEQDIIIQGLPKVPNHCNHHPVVA